MLKLFPHNQEAYNNVVSEFKTENRTCVVHATGTGKSLIACQLIFDNPNAKFLFIAPTIFIFKEIKKHLKGLKFNIDFKTYSFFIDKDLDIYSTYDFIILDEFHRIGAKEWGKAINIILNNNINAKILGLSATHIRYLDDNRDIAEEIFKSNIASYLSLGEAIEKGIHKRPTYITALYNIKNILDGLDKKITNKKDKKRLNSNRIIWEDSFGVDFILKKHLCSDRKKILIFCKDIEHIEFIKNLVTKPLNEIYNNNVCFHSIFSSMGIKEVLNVFREFENNIDTQVLFCIDMLNEGVHIKGVDTILMFRDTISPIIFFQQIGRAFSVGQKFNPLIFDFVNNFNIKNYSNHIIDTFYQNFNSENSNDFYKSRDTILEFFDETLEFSKFFDDFSNNLNDIWVNNFNIYVKFVSEFKRDPKVSEFSWVNTQRIRYKRGLLKEKYIKELLNFNPNFFSPLQLDFYFHLNEYDEFFKKNKRDPKVSELIWFSRIRRIYNQGKLSQDKINACLNVNPNFFDKKVLVLNWFDRLNLYKEFFNDNKRNPTQREMQWFFDQKSAYRKGKLSQDKINACLNINPNFFERKINK